MGMTKQQVLDVYHHKNSGYVPCIFSDMDMLKPKAINERPEGKEGGEDWFGVQWEYVEKIKAPMVKPGTKRLKDVTNWRQELKFPDLSSIDWKKAAEEETAGWDRENRASYIMLINGVFERTHALMGFEDALAAMYEEPEYYKELLDAITEYKLEIIRIIGKYYRPDILAFHDDFGANDRMLMSVDMWERFFRENLKRLIDETHKQGMLFEYHSCGYIEPVFSQLAEIGIDAIEPLQISNPVWKLKKQYQHLVTFVGGFDNQNVLDKEGITEEEVRSEVRRVYHSLAPGGNYVAFAILINREVIPWIVDEIQKLSEQYRY